VLVGMKLDQTMNGIITEEETMNTTTKMNSLEAGVWEVADTIPIAAFCPREIGQMGWLNLLGTDTISGLWKLLPKTRGKS
jgi:hypothetical protein